MNFETKFEVRDKVYQIECIEDRRLEVCIICNGSGKMKLGEKYQTFCPNCHGRGTFLVLHGKEWVPSRESRTISGIVLKHKMNTLDDPKKVTLFASSEMYLFYKDQSDSRQDRQSVVNLFKTLKEAKDECERRNHRDGLPAREPVRVRSDIIWVLEDGTEGSVDESGRKHGDLCLGCVRDGKCETLCPAQCVLCAVVDGKPSQYGTLEAVLENGDILTTKGISATDGIIMGIDWSDTPSRGVVQFRNPTIEQIEPSGNNLCQVFKEELGEYCDEKAVYFSLYDGRYFYLCKECAEEWQANPAGVLINMDRGIVGKPSGRLLAMNGIGVLQFAVVKDED